MRAVHMGDLGVTAARRPDGTLLVRSTAPVPEHARTVTDWLDHWAEIAPDRVFLADRDIDGAWRRVGYAEARRRVRSLGEALLGHDLSADRPLMILSGNDIEHALLGLAAMYVGIPYVPVSPAYSLMSKDFAKLEYVAALLTPGMIHVADGQRFAPALKAILKPDMQLVVARNPSAEFDGIAFSEMEARAPTDRVDAANGFVGPDTIAKFLLTSGSTGKPKAVVNTQRMLCCNQEMIALAWAALADTPPVLVDWLPWNHTAGGNHNFGIVLRNGGTLHIDDGVPSEAGILRTVRNLEEVSPTAYFNVPKGYEMLVAHLRENRQLRERFFADLEFMQYAGAGLAPHVWDGLDELARQTIGERIMMLTGYGSTETAPFAFTTTWPVDRPGEVGLPAAGLEVKLVPNAGKLELRLKGPSITPGYWRQPETTAAAFDAEGYYMIGDALKPVDEADLSRGFMFDGRVSEDFKLDTGTWVNMGRVRLDLIAAFAPYVRDVVLTGLNRPHIGALVFVDPDACRALVSELPVNASIADLVGHKALRAEFQDRLDALAARATGSSTRVARAILLETPPSIDRSEVTDKGSINQRAVMAAREALVEDLYADPPPPHVLVARRKDSQ
ncbi:MAG TPA: feruloyl-CoA synthase [Devosiaceae bacterium]